MKPRSCEAGTAGIVAALCLAVALWAAPAQAAVIGIGVTAKAGTTGIGGDVTVPVISNWINLRAGYNWLNWRPSITEAGLKYKGDVDLETFPILLDFHPLHGNFRITAGAFYNNSTMSLTTFAAPGTEVGGFIVPALSSASLNAKVDWKEEWAPYIGIGWGNAADSNFLDLPIAIGFSLDVGAYYQGNPNVTLTDSSGLVPAPNLRAEEAQIEDEISDFKWYPVVTVGIHIRF